LADLLAVFSQFCLTFCKTETTNSVRTSYVLSLMRSLYLITAMVILERGILDYHIYEESPSLQIITENYIKLLTNLHPVL
jgi:hypothetical protein